MNIYNDVTRTIGKTPLVYLKKSIKGALATVAAKLEFFNPASSVKDRIALNMLETAMTMGKIDHDTVIVEPTSGNTGIGLAMVCAARGLRLKIFMPGNFSPERRKIMKAMGAELELTPAKTGMKGAIEAAKKFCRQNRNVFMPMQFENPANPEIHYRTTGPEIWQDTDGTVDLFVAGAGTGGTITGIGRYLKQMNPGIRVVAVEPAASPVLSGGKPGPHKIQGIGAGFIPEVLDTSLIDRVLTVTDQQAMEMVAALAQKEGIFVGGSAGAAAAAAGILAREEENKGKLIVTLFPDSGDRYLSDS